MPSVAIFKFQFLSGAIKSSMICVGRDGQITFQFLSGAIKSQISTVHVFSILRISIPKWCD